ncbi:hypothetical protein SBA4_5970002 [Candidatus Sulfopaludibacter sp. SbA4]|nr:hypothetical protein SBA4_5970002 [Candidatus Sulfopaludibacter sp. SbA4]
MAAGAQTESAGRLKIGLQVGNLPHRWLQSEQYWLGSPEREWEMWLATLASGGLQI